MVRRDLRKARALANWMVAEPEKFREATVIVPLEMLLRDGAGLLSRERLRILHEVRGRGPFQSLDALADAVGRSKARVSQDVALLEQHGLLHTQRSGRRKAIDADARPILLV